MYEYNAKVKRVIDGDTVDAYIDMGFNVGISVRIRLHGIDTPSIRTLDLKEKRFGLGAKRRVVELLEGNDNNFVVISHGIGKYGRCIGELFIPNPGRARQSLNRILLTEGHATEYNGGSKDEIKEGLIEARKKSSGYVLKHIKPLD